MAAAAFFVIVGMAYALWIARPALLAQDGALSIPTLYLDPGNPLMWALLIAVWLMIVLDGAGQWIDPSDDEPIRQGRPRVWPVLTLALLSAGVWPLVLDRPLVLTVVTGLSAVCATIGTRRAAGRHRPAIGFFAGWATAMASAAIAGLAAERLGLSVQAISALAILPAAAVGIFAQSWVGPSIGYSAALIWAFCALAITTMGTDPVVALAAILGISAMATVLVRAAS